MYGRKGENNDIRAEDGKRMGDSYRSKIVRRWMVVKGRIEINWENESKRLGGDKRIKTDEVG